MSKPRFLCECCGRQMKGAHTDIFNKTSTADCPLCVVDGISGDIYLETSILT